MMFRELSAEEEADFRKWARDFYKPGEDIKGIWHPVIQDECKKINDEHAVFVKDKVSE